MVITTREAELDCLRDKGKLKVARLSVYSKCFLEIMVDWLKYHMPL